jgi:hypothetical protein
MNGLFIAGKEIEDFMHQEQWSFCFIGGLAVLRWGEIQKFSIPSGLPE